MDLTRRAVIDVGTNSVKLLVADVDRASVLPVFEGSEQTRLGRGLYETHQLQPEAVAHTARAVAHFAQIARAHGAAHVRVIATSAAREASNSADLLRAIKTSAGLDVEVISGEQEADLVYRGVRSDPLLAGERLLILDVGGGSSEFIMGHNEHPEFSHSFSIGSVRLLERIRPSDPPLAAELQQCREWLRNFFRDQVRPVVDPILHARRDHTQLVGTGGAATILARMQYRLSKYERHRIEGARITLDAVEHWIKTLWAMPLVERRTVVGLPKKRADVVLTGVAIYEAVLREFGFTELRASTRGLRFAAVIAPEMADCLDPSGT